jgi:hypothetical protein
LLPTPGSRSARASRNSTGRSRISGGDPRSETKPTGDFCPFSYESSRDLQIAGDGAPTIDEGAIAEFALAIGVSTDSGRTYLGDAVEMAYRLPRIWERVTAGEVPVWKARKAAQATRLLPPEGAGFVDRALYFVLKKCDPAAVSCQAVPRTTIGQGRTTVRPAPV